MGKGTGLGLSIVYSTLKAHEGTLAIQSELGRGTCVVLGFPERAASGDTDRSPGASQEAADRRSLEVLLVDDDPLIQQSLRLMVETLGHRGRAATSGEQALELLVAGYRPEVVVLDLNMPGLGGAGTLPELQRLQPGLPVLLATGRADQAALDLVAAHGNATLLAKPFTLEDLAGAFTAVAGRRA